MDGLIGIWIREYIMLPYSTDGELLQVLFKYC